MPANHALLWGSRGTGKSSLVRALLAEHAKAACA
jgi:predicted AAA+ superfamily ATPase